MKHMRGLLAAFCLLAAAAAAGAQGLSVVFLEGKADAGRNSKWADLSVGSSVHPGATVRLPEGSLLQLRGMGVDITLARPGTYPLRDVVSARTSAFVGGAGGIAADASRLIAFGSPKQGVVLGAQSAEEPDKDASNTGGVEDLVENGKEYLRSAQYGKAAMTLTLALALASGGQADEIHYCLAFAYTLDGKLPEAWKQAAALTPVSAPGAAATATPGPAPWAADFSLLRARLLLETSSYGEAISMLTDLSKTLATDAARAPLCFYLSGICYRGAGQGKDAAQAFTQAAALSPRSDLGRSAAILAKVP